MESFTELLNMIKQGQLAELQKVIAAEPLAARQRDSQGISLLLHALYNRQAEIADLIRQANSDLDVFEAASVGDIGRLDLLLQSDAGLANATAGDGFSPLQLACYFGQSSATKVLLNQGAKLEIVSGNPMALRAIHAAASSGDLESVRLLIAHGVDLNSRQHGGYTTLQAAASSGNKEMLELLLAAGADVKVANDQGQTAASLATAKGHNDLADLLAGLLR